jgi:hypothetical protein
MAYHLPMRTAALPRLIPMLALLAAPLIASCQDDITGRVGAGADQYDQGVKADKQYDEQQDKLRNCPSQSMLETSPRLVAADFMLDDAVPVDTVLVPIDLQLAWGSGGGGGGNGGKGHDRNCP